METELIYGDGNGTGTSVIELVNKREISQCNSHPVYCPYNSQKNKKTKCDSRDLVTCISRIDKAYKQSLRGIIPIHPNYFACQTFKKLKER